VTAALKANIGGIIFREVLSDTPNDEPAISSDMRGAREWYYKNVERNENAFLHDAETARQEIIKNLRSPAFRQLAWDTAREFEQAVFPTLPKITSAMLRAKRLGWAMGTFPS